MSLNYWASHLKHSGELDVIRSLALALPSDGVLFDVGANVGEYAEALLAAGQNFIVHAFEPSTAAFAQLDERLGRNTRAVLNQLALSDAPGERALHADAFGSTIGSLEMLGSPIRPFDPKFDQVVTCSTLDDYCKQRGVDRIDFLKVDVEGHEVKVLDGADDLLRQGAIDAIQWEFGENNISSRTYLLDFVERLEGFDFYQVVPGGLTSWHYRGGESEVFATMNYVALRRGSLVAERLAL